MTASLTLTFEDGTSKTILLNNAIEIDTPGLQSLEFRQTRKGAWVMSFTKSLFDGKKVATVKMTKNIHE